MTMAAASYVNYDMSSDLSSTLASVQHQQHSQIYQHTHQQQQQQQQQHISQNQQQQQILLHRQQSNSRLLSSSLAASAVNCGNLTSSTVAASITNSNNENNNNRITSAINNNNSNNNSSQTSVLPSIMGGSTGSSQKDYTIPLHVDCSVEYELPNQPKPPAGQRVEPLLMIHPCYFRKMESQRRSPFVNNMSVTARNNALLVSGLSTSNAPSSSTSMTSTNGSNSVNMSRRVTRQTQVIHESQQQQQQQTSSIVSGAQYQHVPMRNTQQQQQMSQMSQQAHYPVAASHRQHPNSIVTSATTSSSSSTSSNAIYIEHASASRRSSTTSSATQQRKNQNRSSSGTVSNCRSHHTSQNHSASQRHQNLLVQNSSQWDQLAAAAAIAARSSMTPVGATSAVRANQILLPNAQQAIYGKSLAVGKRDAMISGGVYSSNSVPNATIGRISSHLSGNSKHQQQQQQQHQQQQQQHHCISSGSLWDDYTNGPTSAVTTSNGTALLVDRRSPMATVPSNYQAGPDTTPILAMSAAHYARDDKLNGKYRQYLRSHRMHPYLAAVTTPSNVTVVTATQLGQTFATPTPFHHLQQQICFNV